MWRFHTYPILLILKLLLKLFWCARKNAENNAPPNRNFLEKTKTRSYKFKEDLAAHVIESVIERFLNAFERT